MRHPQPFLHASTIALVVVWSCATACPGFPGGEVDTEGSTGASEGPLTEGPEATTSAVASTTSDVPDGTTSTSVETTAATVDPDAGTTSTGPGDATSTSSGTEAGTTDTDTDTDTDGDPEPPPMDGCAASCVAGCEEVLVATLEGHTSLWHAPGARLGLDETGRAMLWAVPGDDVIARYDGVDVADLAADVFAVEVLGTATLRSTADAGLLGSVDVTGATWGLARDGTYAWVADGTSLRLFELDGTLRWERLGDYSDAQVLALSDAIHVQAPATGAAAEHVDVVTQMASTSPFLGSFGGWFHDVPRFWSEQGDAYRLYDTDGTQLAFAVGDPQHGYGEWLVLRQSSTGARVVAIDDVDTPVVDVPFAAIDGAGILGDGFLGMAVLVRLDEPLPAPQDVAVGCCVEDAGWTFAFDDGSFVIGGAEGQVYDEQGDSLTPGEIELLHGSVAGRVGVATTLERTTFWDVSPACVLTEVGSIARQSRPGLLAGDGATFVSVAYHPQLSIDLYDVVTATLFDTDVYGLSTSYHRGMQVSDAADLFGLRSMNTGLSGSSVSAYPWDTWDAGFWALTPAIAPNGLLAVRSDAFEAGFDATFEGTMSYVLDAAGLVAVFEGVTHGFVDDATLLVAHYDYVPAAHCQEPGECDVLVGVELVDTAGVPIAVSPIPEPLEFQRVSSTEVLLPEPPTIYDVYTGAVLWSALAGPAAAVGADHVAHVVDGDLVLTKWR